MNWFTNLFKSHASNLTDLLHKSTDLNQTQAQTIQQQNATISSPAVQAVINANPVDPNMAALSAMAGHTVSPSQVTQEKGGWMMYNVVGAGGGGGGNATGTVAITTAAPYVAKDWMIPQGFPGGNGGVVTLRSQADEDAFIAKYGGPGVDFAQHAEEQRQAWATLEQNGPTQTIWAGLFSPDVVAWYASIGIPDINALLNKFNSIQQTNGVAAAWKWAAGAAGGTYKNFITTLQTILNSQHPDQKSLIGNYVQWASLGNPAQDPWNP